MTNPRLAVIGAGRWGNNILKTLATLNCKVAYQVAEDWRTLLAKDDIEGVIIATPATTHAEIALPFIERGLPVFIEKPMAASLADAERIADAARESDSLVSVGHIHMYNPAYQAAKHLITQSGPVRFLYGEGANNGPYRTDVSAMWDWAPHDLSMILDLMGQMPLSVAAWEFKMLRPDTTLADAAQIKLEFAGGARAITFSSWLMPGKRKRLTIVGEANSIVYDDTLPEQKVAYYKGMGPKVEGAVIEMLTPVVSYPRYDLTPPLALELQAYLRTITAKEKPLSGVDEGLAVVRILDAAERSIALSGVSVPL